VVRAVGVDILVDAVHQVEAMLGREWQERIQALLQVLLRVDQAVERCRVARRPGVARHRFPPGLPLDLLELVADLARAALERRRVGSNETSPLRSRSMAPSTALDDSRMVEASDSGNQPGSHAFPQAVRAA
jgi:hypothetical protein